MKRETEAQVFQCVDVAGTVGRINSQYKHVEFFFIAILGPPRDISDQLACPTHRHRHSLHSH